MAKLHKQKVQVETSGSSAGLTLGQTLKSEQLVEIAADLQRLKGYSLKRKANGKCSGDILGFVRGLRLSARIIYFFRERLSHRVDLQVSWGHLMGEDEEAVSPECDVIIHDVGHVREWNGDKKNPIMEFRFIEAKRARVVISCKSQLTSIDPEYPKALKSYDVNSVFLLAECCRKNRFESLRKKAIEAGYQGLWCLYFTEPSGSLFTTNEQAYVDFASGVLKAVEKAS